MTPETDVIGSYFLELWRLNSKAASAAATATTSNSTSGMSVEDSEFEEAPTELDTLTGSGGFSIVGPDKLSVQYPNVHLHGHDVGVAQANKPAPSKRLIYYFEIFVKNAGAKGQMSIGFTAPGFKLRRQPGYVNGWHINFRNWTSWLAWSCFFVFCSFSLDM
jgi:Ran-binding protein 9/10